jgi:hypothetical protein
MNKLILFIAVAAASLHAGAQTPFSTSNCDITLTVGGESGTNGVAVAYNPSANLYYSVFAGNTAYPLEVHNPAGASLATHEAGYDVRGMWYNPEKKCLEGIAYDNAGSFEVVLNADGTIAGTKALAFSYGMGSQTVATYAEKKKSVLFIEDRTAYFFKPGKLKSTKVVLEPTDPGVMLNTNGPIYTGVKNYEIGVLEAETMSVHLFNLKGKETGTVKLNTDGCNGGIGDTPDYFRVSWCNGRVFIFDTVARTWTGYKLF